MIEEKFELPGFQNSCQLGQALFTPLKNENDMHEGKHQTKERSSISSLKKFKKSVWTREEDELLKSKVIERGSSQWAQIAQFLPNRSGKQCRQRWHNHLREGVSKGAWNIHEYWILSLCVRALGRKWSAMTEYMPGRSDNTIKNQWNCKMKPFKAKFDTNIDMLLSHPELWSSLSEKEERLIKIIAKNKLTGKSVSEEEKLARILSHYCSIIDEALTQFIQARKDLQTCPSSSNELVVNPDEDAPGDLSAAISGGQYIFYESQEENPIRPTIYHAGHSHPQQN